MSYVRSFFYQFFVVFFANYLLPGIKVVEHTKIPRIEGDLWFALGLGVLNFLIFLVLRCMPKHLTAPKIALVAFVINFASYAIVRFFPLGVSFSDLEGYFLASIWVFVGSFLINYFEMKTFHRNHPMNISAGNKPPYEM